VVWRLQKTFETWTSGAIRTVTGAATDRQQTAPKQCGWDVAGGGAEAGKERKTRRRGEKECRSERMGPGRLRCGDGCGRGEGAGDGQLVGGVEWAGTL